MLHCATAHLALDALDATPKHEQAEYLGEHEVADAALHLHRGVGRDGVRLVFVVVVDGQQNLHIAAHGVINIGDIVDASILKESGVVDKVLLGGQHNMKQQRHSRNARACTKLSGIVAANHICTQNIAADLNDAHGHRLQVVINIHILHHRLLGIIV